MAALQLEPCPLYSPLGKIGFQALKRPHGVLRDHTCAFSKELPSCLPKGAVALLRVPPPLDFSLRVSCLSPAQLEPLELSLDWTVVKLKGKHPSHPFNSDVANAFFRAGMIEAWGRGIERILEACRAANTPEPRLRYEPSGLWVEFSYPVIQMDSATPGTGGSGGVTTQKTTQNILAMLARNPSFSRREIAEELGDISENGVKYHLEKLKASGRIRRLGADKGGYWEVLK